MIRWLDHTTGGHIDDKGGHVVHRGGYVVHRGGYVVHRGGYVVHRGGHHPRPYAVRVGAQFIAPVRGGHHPRPYISRPSERGITLIEILIVLGIIALIGGVAIPSFNAVTHLRLRNSATRLAGTIRYLYSQAALKGLCMRVVFDLKTNSYRIEATTDGHCLVGQQQQTALQAKRKEEEEARKAKEKKDNPAASSSTSVGGWGGEQPISLELKKATFSQYNQGLLRDRRLSQGVEFLGIFVAHQKEVYTQKRGPRYTYLHCFPLGRCELAVIYLKDTSGQILSLEVKPLTGRVVIHDKKLRLQDYHTDRQKGEDDATGF